MNKVKRDPNKVKNIANPVPLSSIYPSIQFYSALQMESTFPEKTPALTFDPGNESSSEEKYPQLGFSDEELRDIINELDARENLPGLSGAEFNEMHEKNLSSPHLEEPKKSNNLHKRPLNAITTEEQSIDQESQLSIPDILPITGLIKNKDFKNIDIRTIEIELSRLEFLKKFIDEWHTIGIVNVTPISDNNRYRINIHFSVYANWLKKNQEDVAPPPPSKKFKTNIFLIDNSWQKKEKVPQPPRVLSPFETLWNKEPLLISSLLSATELPRQAGPNLQGFFKQNTSTDQAVTRQNQSDHKP